MRFDALACNGGTVARTPTIDSLASTGLNYVRAHNQNVVCRPASSGFQQRGLLSCSCHRITNLMLEK
jgi:arylsulfatase A-like enzyme